MFKRMAYVALILALCAGLVAVVVYDRQTKAEEAVALQELKEEVAAKDKEEREQEEEEDTSADNTIVCIGDAMTWGTQKITYTSLITSNVSGYNMDKIGGYWDTSDDIAIRCGVTKIYVKDVTIPANPKAVAITIYDEDGNEFDVLHNTGSNFKQVEIAGIAGTLKYDAEKKTHYFTRSTAGTKTKITSLTQITSTIPSFNKNNIFIFWMGNCDPYYNLSIFHTTNQIKAIINACGIENYIVVGLTSKRRYTIVDDMNKVVKNQFGDHYLDIRTYLMEKGLKKAGLTATKDDKTDLVKHYIPRSLLLDDLIHFNKYSNQILVDRLVKKMQTLKYIDSSSDDEDDDSSSSSEDSTDTDEEASS